MVKNDIDVNCVIVYCCVDGEFYKRVFNCVFNEY